MKKSILIMTTALGFAFMANAQSTNKGTITLGGNVSYNYQKVVDANGNTQAYSILPGIGYFIKNNFTAGFNLGYAGTTAENESDNKTVSGEFALAPYARFYTGTSNVKFFGQLSIPMGWGTNKSGGTKTRTTERYGAALSPGVVFFPNNKVGIEFSVLGLHYQYSSQKQKNGSKIEVNQFGLYANSLKPSIGINFYL